MKFQTQKQDNFETLFLEFKIPFVEKKFRANLQLYSIPNEYVLGYSSRCKDGKYVLLMDYDYLAIEDIKEELQALQESYKLGDFHIFKTDRENSFHAVCLDKFTMSEAYYILKKTSCDQAFINAIRTLQYREWVLRIGEKGKRKAPKYFCTIESNYTWHEKSLAHALFLEKYYSFEIKRNGNWDSLKKIAIIKYNTANRIKAI